VSLINHWRDRHPRPSGSGKVFFLIALLIMVIIVILKAPEITRVFAEVFFPAPDSTETTVE
jgi:hypothetical protein